MGCEHFCVSLGGGRGQCVCADGYYIELDKKSCLCKELFFTWKKNLEDTSPFCGATDTHVLDLWWCLPWDSKPGWIPHLHAFSPACNGFLRFTSGVTPANCIEVTVATKPFRPTYLQIYPQALVGFEPTTMCAAAQLFFKTFFNYLHSGEHFHLLLASNRSSLQNQQRQIL